MLWSLLLLQSSVDILELIRRILPSVCSLNNKLSSMKTTEKGGDDIIRVFADFTNPGAHYSWVESDHPYKPATLVHYK